jgi:hypothetical protein
VNHRKGYVTVAEAARSKAAQVPGAVIDEHCRCGLVHVNSLAAPSAKSASPRQPRARLRPVSVKRQRENLERRAMIAALWPDGRPRCEWAGCTRLADDVHEALSRARGGSITDPGNARALCRPHHDRVTFTPESELADAYAAGLLVHSWDAPKGAAA